MLPHDIISIIQDTNFWNQLYELQNLLFPLCCVLNKLQKDVARLYEIAHCFGWIIKIFASHNDKSFSDQIVARLEKQWTQWEHLLLLLSLVLHPRYRLTKFSSNISGLTYTHFAQWLNYYYNVWFEETPRRILREFLSYQRDEFPFNKEAYNQFDENIVDFWEMAKGLAPELS
jgi:hypothetical protein